MRKLQQFIGYLVVMGWIGGCTYGYACHNDGWVAAGGFLFFATLVLSEWR
jgi:hypothetical protein